MGYFMKLILSGGGSGEKTKEIDDLFASLIDKNKPLLYLPIAIDTKKHPYPECLKWLKNQFEIRGIKKYIMITEKEIKKGDLKLTNFGGLYIGGGNTPYLLKTLKESGFWILIQEMLRLDIPIYGGSAGAIIFAKTIIPSLSQDDNNVKLTDFSAMNKINDYNIWCHYSADLDQIISQYIKKYHLSKTIAVSEKTGIFVTDNQIKVIGQESVYIFDSNKKKEIKTGQYLS